MKSTESLGIIQRLQEIMISNAEVLIDQWILLVEQDIDDGWRAFYAREVWMRENLPPPLINQLGRALMVEELKVKMSSNDGLPQFNDVCMIRVIAKRLELADYRNYLHVGVLSLERNAAPLDLVADATVTQLLETENRHIEFEIKRNEQNWYLESAARCSLTPPLFTLSKNAEVPVRDINKSLAFDTDYWCRLYEPEHRIVIDGDNNGMFTPSVSLALMDALAPDFPFVEVLSTKKRLVFMQSGDSLLAWVIVIEKIDGGRAFRYPPQLMLTNRSLGRKLKDDHILFYNVLDRRYISNALDGQAAMELELRFHLPRYRRLIEVYQPYVNLAVVAP